jgi:hypothetical protein
VPKIVELLTIKIKTMSAPKNLTPNVADATTPKEIGKSVVTSFRYHKDYCFVTLKNGVTGIVGSASVMTFAAMLSLKGTGIEVKYERLTDKDGYKRYRLEWSLE